MTSILILIMRKGRNLYIKIVDLQIKNIILIQLYSQALIDCYVPYTKPGTKNKKMNETETNLAFTQFCLGEPL